MNDATNKIHSGVMTQKINEKIGGNTRELKDWRILEEELER